MNLRLLGEKQVYYLCATQPLLFKIELLSKPPTKVSGTDHQDEEERRVEDDPLGEEPAPLASSLAEKTSLVFPTSFLSTPFLSSQLPTVFVDAEVVGVVDVVVVDVVDVADADVAVKAIKLFRGV